MTNIISVPSLDLIMAVENALEILYERDIRIGEAIVTHSEITDISTRFQAHRQFTNVVATFTIGEDKTLHTVCGVLSWENHSGKNWWINPIQITLFIDGKPHHVIWLDYYPNVNPTGIKIRPAGSKIWRVGWHLDEIIKEESVFEIIV